MEGVSRKRALSSSSSESEGATKRRAVEDAETASMLQVISQHAEHRGPQELGNGRHPERKYMRGKSNREEGNKINTAFASNGRLDVGSSYICHMCGEAGHHIRLCPQKQGRKLSKKIRAAPGIPRSWLRVISRAEINEYNDVYHLANGQLAVLAKEASALEKPEAEAVDLGSPPCLLCHKLFTDPQLATCCGWTYCNLCIREFLDTVHKCPKCNTPATDVVLVPNPSVQDSRRSPAQPTKLESPPSIKQEIPDTARQQETTEAKKEVPNSPPQPPVARADEVTGYKPPFAFLLPQIVHGETTNPSGSSKRSTEETLLEHNSRVD